uniref:Pancreatic trypsin inhibitor n=1 Tax=Rhipicephalus zambeziensis TaxID=60191 RepID=A0A224YGT1_9ACAR
MLRYTFLKSKAVMMSIYFIYMFILWNPEYANAGGPENKPAGRWLTNAWCREEGSGCAAPTASRSYTRWFAKQDGSACYKILTSGCTANRYATEGQCKMYCGIRRG